MKEELIGNILQRLQVHCSTFQCGELVAWYMTSTSIDDKSSNEKYMKRKTLVDTWKRRFRCFSTNWQIIRLVFNDPFLNANQSCLEYPSIRFAPYKTSMFPIFPIVMKTHSILLIDFSFPFRVNPISNNYNFEISKQFQYPI